MNTQLPRAVLLDLDDTIIDDSSNIESAWTQACSDAAPHGVAADRLKDTVLAVRLWYWADPERNRLGRLALRDTSAAIVEEALSRLGVKDSTLAGDIANRYRDLRERGAHLHDGAVETIERLRAEGVALALVTNGEGTGQRAKIERFDLARHFDYICIEGEFGCGKPDERVYRGALDALRCEPADAWMVGDNLEFDVLAPIRLGITGVWVDRLGAGVPANHPYEHRVIHTLSELL